MKHRILLVIIIGLAFLLRFFQLSEYPVGLSLDEASIGINAYSLLNSGVDEHGVYYPLWFKAFGEYKLPVYLYLTEFSFFLFGKSEFALRLPSALFGSLTVLFFYHVVKQLLASSFLDKKYLAVPFLCGFLLAISPWHLQFSRAGFEATVGLFLFLAGISCYFLFSTSTKFYYLYVSFICFVLSLYCYNVYRLLIPLTILFLWYIDRRLLSESILRFKPRWLGLFVLINAATWPFIAFVLSGEGSARLQQVSVIHTAADFLTLSTYTTLFAHYFGHFSFINLFLADHHLGQFHTDYFGLQLKVFFPFFIIGIIHFFKLPSSRLKALMFFLLLSSPIAATFTLPSPHALRSLPLVLPSLFIISLGLIVAFSFFKKYRYYFVSVFCLALLFEFSFFVHSYTTHYSTTGRIHWGSYYKEMIREVRRIRDSDQFDIVAFNTDGTYQPYVYLQFYGEDLGFQFVDGNWQKPVGARVLYISKAESTVSGKEIITITQGLGSPEIAFRIQEL